MSSNVSHDKNTKTMIAGHDRTALPFSYDFHFHDNYEIYLFVDGQGEMLVNHSRYSLVPGTLLIFNSNEVHKVLPSSAYPYERMTIHFSPGLIRALPLQSCNLLSCFQNRTPGASNAALLSGDTYEQFKTLVLSLIHHIHSAEYGQEAMALSCLTQILVLTNQAFYTSSLKNLPLSSFVSQAVMYIEKHVAEPLSLSILAKVLSVDSFYLSHQFKEQIGASPYHYILVQKIAYAKILLAQGKSCIDVCEEAGFGEYNNFSRTFKKYVGLTPLQYKKQNSF
ncbi:AraC family transcriptional regulator [Lachnospiraceae bacterium OttesenSCG-928-D06]|nr:AraC family transcriptional regulator [Lachnospiraceae bacterium OttesenSCG-928-D06]